MRHYLFDAFQPRYRYGLIYHIANIRRVAKQYNGELHIRRGQKRNITAHLPLSCPLNHLSSPSQVSQTASYVPAHLVFLSE